MRRKKPETQNGVPFFRSPLLSKIDGLVHAFPCRTGKAGESLNALVDRMGRAFGIDCIVTLNQIHSAELVLFQAGVENPQSGGQIKADAAITAEKNVAVGIRTADCVPILIADPVNKVVAAAHAGWRGAIGGIIEQTIAKMKETYHSDPGDLIAAIGPHIMSCCYEVGPEVASVFRDRFGEKVLLAGKGDRSYLDLQEAVAAILLNERLKKKNIDKIGLCTCCNEDLFYSYRREGKGRGRQFSFIYFRQ